MLISWKEDQGRKEKLLLVWKGVVEAFISCYLPITLPFVSVTNLEGCVGEVQFRVSAAGPGGFGPPSMSSIPVNVPMELSERGTTGWLFSFFAQKISSPFFFFANSQSSCVAALEKVRTQSPTKVWCVKGVRTACVRSPAFAPRLCFQCVVTLPCRCRNTRSHIHQVEYRRLEILYTLLSILF